MANELKSNPLLQAHFRERAQRRMETGPPAPPPGDGDRGFILKAGVGVYAGNDAQRDIIIPPSAFGPVRHTPDPADSGAVVYAPTHLPDVDTGSRIACIEATTIHWRFKGESSTTDDHGFWDWCAATPSFAVQEDMNDSAWRSKYVRTYDNEERFYVSVIPEDPANAAGGCWQGLLWNFTTGAWEEKLESCGNGPTDHGSRGWTMWEQWYHQTCPTYPHIRADDVQIKLTDSTWVFLEDQYTDDMGTGSSVPCWGDTTYVFDVHTTSPDQWEWFAHTTPLSASISGPTFISSAGTYEWAANAAGAHPVYAYQWEYCPLNGSCSNVGTSSSYSRFVSMMDFSFDLRLTVTSSIAVAKDTVNVCIDGQPC